MEQNHSLKSRRLNEFDLLEFLAIFLMVTAQTNGIVMKSITPVSHLQSDLIALNNYLANVSGTLLLAFCIGEITAINDKPPSYYIKNALLIYGSGIIINSLEAFFLYLYSPSGRPETKDYFTAIFTDRLFIYLALILIIFAIVIATKKTVLLCSIFFILTLFSGNRFLQELSVPMAGFLFGNLFKKEAYAHTLYVRSTFLSTAVLIGIPSIQLALGMKNYGFLRILWAIALFMTIASILQPFIFHLRKFDFTYLPFSSNKMLHLYITQKVMVFLSIPLLLQVPDIYSCCLISFVLYCISLLINYLIFQTKDKKEASIQTII